jgi:hypothetical protein
VDTEWHLAVDKVGTGVGNVGGDARARTRLHRGRGGGEEKGGEDGMKEIILNFRGRCG